MEAKRDVLFDDNLYPCKNKLVNNPDVDYFSFYSQQEFLQNNDCNTDEDNNNLASHDGNFNTADEQESSILHKQRIN